MSKLTILMGHYAKEFFKDYAGQLSFGRLASAISFVIATGVAIVGLYFGIRYGKEYPQIYSYAIQITTLFLGTSLSFYGASKTTETLTKKWAPDISTTIASNLSSPVIPAPAPVVPDKPKTPLPPGAPQPSEEDMDNTAGIPDEAVK